MNESRWKLLVLALLGGFVLMAFEVRSMHAYVIPQNWQGWIPVVASWTGVATCACLLAKREKFAKFGALLFAAIMCTGLFGAYRHTEGHIEPFLTTISATIPRLAPVTKEDGNTGGGPPLAPLALCGLGFMGLIASTKK